MRNDEKIDIQLNEVSEENLSAEEIAQQHYDTALRYINIAEHMKQFEDQDKYYHRAIKYLRLSRPYVKVRPLLRELRRKKFTARAEGKIALYEEACRIRDRAQTPNDYYSAQTVFDRIHRHELSHKIPKKRIDAALYERVCECSDSEQQAIECGKKAEETAAQQKRHSLFVTTCFIAAVIALLAFSRTLSFRKCLATAAAVTGDHESAWHSYYRIYEKTEDVSAFDHYQNHRYQAALHAEKSGNYEEATKDYYALARDGYKDSAQKLLSLEQKQIFSTENGELVSFANMKWRVLEKKKDKALLIKDQSVSKIPFQTGNKESSWEASHVRQWLNQEFLEENFCQTEIDAVLLTTLPPETNPTYGTTVGNTTSDKVFLLSAEEAARYQNTLHKTKTCWWLRTPGAHEGSMCFMYKDLSIMDYGYDCHSDIFTVKPAIWVSAAQ